MSCCSCDDHDYCCRCVDNDADRAELIIADVLDGSYDGECDQGLAYVDSLPPRPPAMAAEAIVAVLKYEHIL